MTVPIQLLPMALALAGASGLRAFLPLFYLSLALHYGLLQPQQVNVNLVEYLDLVNSKAVLVGLGVLALVEMAVEKVPALTDTFDVTLLVLRLVSAVVVALAVIPLPDLPQTIALAVLVGFVGAISIVNLQVRYRSADVEKLPLYVNFAASLLMDAICLAVVSIGLQMPYVGIVILYPGTWLVTLFIHTWKGTLERAAQLKGLNAAPEMPDDVLRRTRGSSPP